MAATIFLLVSFLLGSTLAGAQEVFESNPNAPDFAGDAVFDDDQQRIIETLPLPPVNPPLRVVQGATPVLTPWGLAVDDHIIEPRAIPYELATVELVDHSFGNSYGSPFVGHYQPPKGTFDRAFINLTVVSEGRQYDRLATMWLNDTEVFRTSTAEPTEHPGIAWTYLKDMTAYMSLWEQDQTVIFDLGNLLSDRLTGLFNVTVSVTLFRGTPASPTGPPADMIIPISKMTGVSEQPSYFRFPGERAETNVSFPSNVRRAVLSVAATAQADDEFWWSNVPESDASFFDDRGNLPGKGSFREVQVRIDDRPAGLVWPFPVVFTGGISPPLHRPIVSPEAFDLREYEIDITLWLGVLCNGFQHTFDMEVLAIDDSGSEPKLVNAPSNWILSGKIFIWLDPEESATTGTYPDIVIDDLEYQNYDDSISGHDLRYNQIVRRGYSSNATISTNDGSQNRTWNQSFEMRNIGSVNHHGRNTTVNADYLGEAVSALNAIPVYSCAFRYPIDSTFWYRDPDENHSLELLAELNQTSIITTFGVTPFYTGIDPFHKRLPWMTAGVTAFSSHNATGTFYQSEGGERSSGFSNIEQIYALGARQYHHIMSPSEAPPIKSSFYHRTLDAVNDTITRDSEDLQRKRVRSIDLRDQTPLAKEPSSYAPLTSQELGGRKVFRNQEVDALQHYP